MNEEENKAVNPETEAAQENLPEVAPESEPAVIETESVSKEEVSAEKPEETKADDVADSAEKLEHETMYELTKLYEEGNEENEKIVNDAAKRLHDIFKQLNDWIITNTDPRQVKINLEKTAEQSKEILEETRKRVIAASDSPEFKKTVEAGKDFLTGTGQLIGEGLEYGKEQLSRNPFFKSLFEHVDEGVDKIRSDQNLADAVTRTQQGVDKLNNALFDGLRSFFTTPENHDDTEKKD